jgi:hypothetical protein
LSVYDKIFFCLSSTPFPCAKFFSDVTVKMHNTLEKQECIHWNTICVGLSLDTSSDLGIIVLFYSEDIAVELRRRKVSVTDLSTWGRTHHRP